MGWGGEYSLFLFAVFLCGWMAWLTFSVWFRPLPMRKIKQKRVMGQGWVVE
jgi:hypothetical protein